MTQVEHELKHYGVLGMKWGVRRAALKTDAVQKAKANNKAQKTEKSKAAYRSALSKAKKSVIDKYADDHGYDRKTARAVNKMEASELFVKTYLFGSYGALKYTQAKTEGNSRGVAAVKAILSGSLNNLSYFTLSAFEGHARKKRTKSE